MKKAIYPGTFDPVTNGHISLIERACHLFQELIVAVASSTEKTPLFNSEERIDFMTSAIAELPDSKKIRVVGFDGLTADLVRELNADAIVRGLRAVSDFEFEFQMALMNRKMARDVETVFLMPSLSWVYLSSSLIKNVAEKGGPVGDLVPKVVKHALAKKFGSDK